MNEGKIFVVCPGGVVTGGPELLHQLVDELRGFGVQAFMSYHPFDRSFDVPAAYKHYNISQQQPEDTSGNILVIPESATRLVRSFHSMRIVIWWQSVDNYYRIPSQKGWRAWVPKAIANRLARLPLNALRPYLHAVQSEYARLHLEEHGIAASKLGDYLALAHRETDADIVREDVVTYNPRKGADISTRLKAALPNIVFRPIENMTSEQVNHLLKSVKLYMDFGPHPGKDRLPREAAAAGACVVTGMQGSARNSIDIPIPQKYKIDEYSIDLPQKFERLVNDVFNDFETASLDFDDYRAKIFDERQEFSTQCRDLFGSSIFDINSAR